MKNRKNKITVRGLITAKEPKKPTTYIWLSYKNVHYQLNDPDVNDDNFTDTQKNHPEKVIGIRHYLMTIKVPIKKIHVRAIGNEPFTNVDLSWHSESEEREEDD